MRFRFLLTFSCLLSSAFLFAGNFIGSTPTTNATILDVSACELPPPNDFHLIEQGPTYVRLAWTPIMDAAQHRIKVYRTSDGLLLSNTVVPAGETKATIDNLPLNTNMYATINTICQNGDDGPPSANFPFKGFIMDLIVAGFTTGTEQDCPIQSAGQSCTFYTDGTITPFRVYRNNNSREFGVSAQLEIMTFHTHIGTNGNSGQTINIKCDNTETVPCGPAAKIKISYDLGNGTSLRIADFELVQTSMTGVGRLRCTSITQGWTIERTAAGPSGDFMPGKGKGSFEQHHDNGKFPVPTASPNPFSNTLDIFPNNPAAASITLQMYNLSGQKVLDQQFAGGQEQYSLSTEGLATGFYFLRIEADGEVQTLKVVKSE